MTYSSSRTGTRIRGASLAFGLALLAPAAAVAQQHFPSDKDLTVMLRYLVEDGARFRRRGT
jgi:hypothetical protein